MKASIDLVLEMKSWVLRSALAQMTACSSLWMICVHIPAQQISMGFRFASGPLSIDSITDPNMIQGVGDNFLSASIPSLAGQREVEISNLPGGSSET